MRYIFINSVGMYGVPAMFHQILGGVKLLPPTLIRHWVDSVWDEHLKMLTPRTVWASYQETFRVVGKDHNCIQGLLSKRCLRDTMLCNECQPFLPPSLPSLLQFSLSSLCIRCYTRNLKILY